MKFAIEILEELHRVHDKNRVGFFDEIPIGVHCENLKDIPKEITRQVLGTIPSRDFSLIPVIRYERNFQRDSEHRC